MRYIYKLRNNFNTDCNKTILHISIRETRNDAPANLNMNTLIYSIGKFSHGRLPQRVLLFEFEKLTWFIESYICRVSQISLFNHFLWSNNKKHISYVYIWSTSQDKL